MQLRHFLEDFGTPSTARTARTDGPALDESEVEAQKLESFEAGYRAGWDDAVKAHAEDHTRVSSAFGQNLQDLSFTYHEAYSQVVTAMTPLLEEMVNVLLPQIARDGLGQHIVTQLKDMAREVGSFEVVIAVAPVNAPAVAALLEEDFGFPLRLQEDDTLGEGQADIRFGETEKQIDLSDVLRTVSEAVQGFAHENRRQRANG